MRSLHRAGFLVLAAAVVGLAPVSPLRPLDQASEAWLERSSSSAVTAYATVRVLNASVSVLKESSLELEPAGVGVSLALGQLLDPLDDMTERLSDVIVVAIVTLAGERILQAIAADYTGIALAVLILVWAGATLLPRPRARPLERWALVAAAAVLAVRLTPPLTAAVGHLLHERYLAPEMASARAEIEVALVELEGLVDVDFPRDEGFWGAMTGAGRLVRERMLELHSALVDIEERVEGLVPALLRLTGLWATAVFLQGVVVPLGVFALVWGLLRASFRGVVAVTR